jgi:hypothetical protein
VAKKKGKQETWDVWPDMRERPMRPGDSVVVGCGTANGGGYLVEGVIVRINKTTQAGLPITRNIGGATVPSASVTIALPGGQHQTFQNPHKRVAVIERAAADPVLLAEVIADLEEMAA